VPAAVSVVIIVVYLVSRLTLGFTGQQVPALMSQAVHWIHWCTFPDGRSCCWEYDWLSLVYRVRCCVSVCLSVCLWRCYATHTDVDAQTRLVLIQSWNVSRVLFFRTLQLMQHSGVIVASVRPSVRLSVCHMLLLCDCDWTNPAKITQSSSLDNPVIPETLMKWYVHL